MAIGWIWKQFLRWWSDEYGAPRRPCEMEFGLWVSSKRRPRRGAQPAGRRESDDQLFFPPPAA
jgi:hypothetical protein